MKPEDRYDSLFVIYGDRHRVPAKLLKAVAYCESSFLPEAVSPAGAQGLFQFMPPTFKEWSKKLEIEKPDPFNPEHSTQCGAAYLSWLIDQMGNGEKALAAYNWGIGNLKTLLAEHPQDWREHLPEETKDYIEKVQGVFAAYNAAKN